MERRLHKDRLELSWDRPDGSTVKALYYLAQPVGDPRVYFYADKCGRSFDLGMIRRPTGANPIVALAPLGIDLVQEILGLWPEIAGAVLAFKASWEAAANE